MLQENTPRPENKIIKANSVVIVKSGDLLRLGFVESTNGNPIFIDDRLDRLIGTEISGDPQLIEQYKQGLREKIQKDTADLEVLNSAIGREIDIKVHKGGDPNVNAVAEIIRGLGEIKNLDFLAQRNIEEIPALIDALKNANLKNSEESNFNRTLISKLSGIIRQNQYEIKEKIGKDSYLSLLEQISDLDCRPYIEISINIDDQDNKLALPEDDRLRIKKIRLKIGRFGLIENTESVLGGRNPKLNGIDSDTTFSDLGELIDMESDPCKIIAAVIAQELLKYPIKEPFDNVSELLVPRLAELIKTRERLLVMNRAVLSLLERKTVGDVVGSEIQGEIANIVNDASLIINNEGKVCVASVKRPPSGSIRVAQLPLPSPDGLVDGKFCFYLRELSLDELAKPLNRSGELATLRPIQRPSKLAEYTSEIIEDFETSSIEDIQKQFLAEFLKVAGFDNKDIDLYFSMEKNGSIDIPANFVEKEKEKVQLLLQKIITGNFQVQVTKRRFLKKTGSPDFGNWEGSSSVFDVSAFVDIDGIIFTDFELLNRLKNPDDYKQKSQATWPKITFPNHQSFENGFSEESINFVEMSGGHQFLVIMRILDLMTEQCPDPEYIKYIQGIREVLTKSKEDEFNRLLSRFQIEGERATSLRNRLEKIYTKLDSYSNRGEYTVQDRIKDKLDQISRLRWQILSHNPRDTTEDSKEYIATQYASQLNDVFKADVLKNRLKELTIDLETVLGEVESILGFEKPQKGESGVVTNKNIIAYQQLTQKISESSVSSLTVPETINSGDTVAKEVAQILIIARGPYSAVKEQLGSNKGKDVLVGRAGQMEKALSNNADFQDASSLRNDILAFKYASNILEITERIVQDLEIPRDEIEVYFPKIREMLIADQINPNGQKFLEKWTSGGSVDSAFEEKLIDSM